MTKENIEYLASLLSSCGFGFNESVVILVVTLFSSLAGSYCGSYLKKKGELLGLKENYNDLKSQLQQNTKLVEEIKSSVEINSFKEKHKFEKYYQFQVECIQKVYELLLEVHEMGDYIIRYTQVGNRELDKSNQFHAAVREFVRYSRSNRIWLPDDIYSDIDDVVRTIRDSAIRLEMARNKNIQSIDFDKLYKIEDSAFEELQVKIPIAMDKLIEDIRSRIGPKNG
jgi:hypothetical protein